jgi:hypothetical protein
MPIKDLFDPSKNIYRAIEKVITYDAAQEARLKAEITEYVVTDSINEQFGKLLMRMQAAMDAGGQNDIGVWVSGFYGSGKSSFTKYLGLALDDTVTVDGVRFLKHLQDRLNSPQAKALLSTVASRYPAAIVLLDLASEMLAGATMEDVSTVLYYKVLHWAGYSRNLKVATFERKLKKDGRFQEFTHLIQNEYGVDWKDVQNDTLVVDSIVPEIAHKLYPNLFPTPSSFTTETSEVVRFENDRVKEMIDIARETTGKQYIIFIVDEVGQYVASRPSLILNLDGLAKNLKNIGDGKVWIIGTAQQRLTQDDPRAAINSPELFKLQDRFPIQITLESNDIKEISHRRLLGKSAEGERTLGVLFDQYGQALRHNTKLENARYYDSNFDKDAFINLYPFLPAHFDVLLQLLGVLAKSTGGIGLRSAIKVIQDILVEGVDGQAPIAEQQVGWLATTVTLYDALARDIQRAAPSIAKSVGKALLRFPDSRVHQDVAKTVAVLQILDNMPVTAQNISSLMQASVDAPSRRQDVDAAIVDLITDSIVPFGEKDGNLIFFSERLNDIDQERSQLPVMSFETFRIRNDALREAFSPLPSVRLHQSLSVTSGLKAVEGARHYALAGERETIQTLVELVDASNYETVRNRIVDESRQRSAHNAIYLLGRSTQELTDKANDIYRSQEIARRYVADPDQEVKSYVASQGDRAKRLIAELQQQLLRALRQGSFVFRGQITAVDSLDQNVLEAMKKHLVGAADLIFEHYQLASVRVETALAEKFLKAPNLRSITKEIDPLGLVQISGGKPKIYTDHKALISIRDYIERSGTVDGKRLTDHFTAAPFGWSQDTLRYLLAVLLVAGEIKLKVSGREVTVNGQQAIEALRTNNAFKTVGVALRNDRPSNEVLARAAERLTNLTGDSVIPLEDEISRAAIKFFPTCQLRFGGLPARLSGLNLPGSDIVRSLTQELADVLLADASDAPQRLGGEQSPLHENLTWAAHVNTALNNGLEATVRDLREYCREINALPDTGVPGQLRAGLDDELVQIEERLAQDTFYKHTADLNTRLTAIKARTQAAAMAMIAAQQETIKQAQIDLQRLPMWRELTQQEQQDELGQIEALAITTTPDLHGLQQLLRNEYRFQSQVQQRKQRIEQLGAEREAGRVTAENERVKMEREKLIREGRQTLQRTIRVPSRVTSQTQLDQLLNDLQQFKRELPLYTDFNLTLEVEDQ